MRPWWETGAYACDEQRDDPQLMYLLPSGSALVHRRPSLFPVRWTRSLESVLCPCSTSWHGFLARAGPLLHGRKRKPRSQTLLFRLRSIASPATLARLSRRDPLSLAHPGRPPVGLGCRGSPGGLAVAQAHGGYGGAHQMCRFRTSVTALAHQYPHLGGLFPMSM
ncbi:uncharacterized protein CC84DRAFT_750882 [Paraphaeosphaeria sporulosa]|uniref:Uncharacterized protein n=1 Tax=Paraphaeosphaeria sporulosa TaxID=1460663 RepID=A0A177CHD9_9PLEO|nr:uncharacterized protein CC84DRAFT_750882 [Paraphaeosphaeria sporulosa]OAG06137.1 hypothetical protein CC84DRAFT_750882 [Paraphaeosphaeria sporulosa]